ncbi:MAG: HlyD family efflux transporter periplasmic adaptor subunit [Prevotellaceae bacterium]|jgi:multidrug efflux pump subunit AcrA (membrane-fusion protein)|nr:HlyD family efflux transporter periplasmic adaptor subunit [Prevotellaceae bacterium]
MKKKRWLIIGAIAVAALLIWVFGVSSGSAVVEQEVRVRRGPFEVIVATTGELKAQSMERIEGPEGLRARSIRLQEIKIQDLIPEGTVVKKGDYVATLDRSAAATRQKDLEDEVEKVRAQLERTLLDTSLNLRGIRNNLVNLKFDMEEKQIAVEQSVYEPPATQRQAQNNLERAARDYEQELQNYTLKEAQAEGQIKDVRITLYQRERELTELLSVLDQFIIYAPNDGMVIYYREWGGDKRKVGSSISPWDATIATLPDLSVMESKTYVNEIDISKIKKGQQVRLGVDAFPEKQYTGVITEVSNVGEQIKNADAKVFEVIVRINESDPILRPSMTTSNKIITAAYSDVVYVPIEAIFGTDTMTYVYRTNGVKQIVVPGEMNDNFRIIEQGLKESDEVYLSLPEGGNTFKLVGTEYIDILKQRVKEKKEAEEKLQKEAEEGKNAKMRQMEQQEQPFPGQMPGISGMNIRIQGAGSRTGHRPGMRTGAGTPAGTATGAETPAVAGPGTPAAAGAGTGTPAPAH